MTQMNLRGLSLTETQVETRGQDAGLVVERMHVSGTMFKY